MSVIITHTKGFKASVLPLLREKCSQSVVIISLEQSASDVLDTIKKQTDEHGNIPDIICCDSPDKLHQEPMPDMASLISAKEREDEQFMKSTMRAERQEKGWYRQFDKTSVFKRR